MLRLAGILLTAASALVAVVLTWPSLFRLERTFPVAQLVSFRPALAAAFAAAALVLLLVALVRPLRLLALLLAVIAGAASAANAATVWTRGLGTETMPEKTASSIRVMTWNTAGEATSAESIAKVAVTMGADIVTLPETTIETGEQVAIAMRELGSPMWAHHTEYYPGEGWDAHSTTLLITPELGDYSVIESSQNGSSNTSTLPSAVAMPVDGTGPIVVAAHAVAPRPEYMAQWRADLRWLADQCADANVIMAGDFNATVDHMSGLGVDGGDMGRCQDAARLTGNGSVGTWSTGLPAILGTSIDHIMASPHWTPTASLVLRTTDGSGSDHRPLIVQYEPASP